MRELFSSRFLWQVWLTVGGLVLLSTVAFAILISNQLHKNFLLNIEDSLYNQAEVLKVLAAPILSGSQLTGSQIDTQIDTGALEQFGRDRGIRITLIGTDGRVWFDNLEAAETMDNHGTRPEILQAFERGVGTSQRFSMTLEKPMFYLASSLVRDNDRLGYVRISVSLSDIEEQLGRMQQYIYMTGLGIAAIFLMISYLLVLRFSKPVLDMTRMSVRLARGEYNQRLQLERHDELGQLANALNQLAAGTEHRINALMLSRNQLAAVLSGLAEGVIAVDLDQRVIHINDSALEFLGQPLIKPLVEMHFWELVRAVDICQALDQCFANQTKINIQADLHNRMFDLSIVPLQNEGMGVGAILVLNDITEFARLGKVKTDFVANASHELKTPISAIKGFVETILDDANMTSKIRHQFLTRIMGHAERLDDIVKDLLHLSRFDGMTSEPEMKPLDMALLLKQVYLARKDEAAIAKLDFRLDLPDEPAVIRGDRIAIWQLVTNLIDNAFTYIGKEGMVYLKLNKKEHHVEIQVIDNGIGVPLNEHQRIFERFYRVDKVRTGGKGGTGLGLAIVKHIAQSHKGMVSLESDPGKGSVFTVQLPLDV